jgi:hypothetical protein
MLHTKPTKEELQAQMEQSLKALETIDKLEENPVVETPKVETTKETPKVEEVKKTEEVKTENKITDKTTEEVVEDEKEIYKKKFTNSSREVQVLQSRTQKYDNAVVEAESVKPPTDEEMAKQYGKDEWEALPSINKTIAKDAWVSNRRFEIMSQASKAGKDIEAWNTKVDEFITDPKNLTQYPELEGKTEEFKAFSAKPSRRGLDFEDLVLAFNGDVAKNMPAPNKGKMFEMGTAGGNEKPAPKDDKISLSEANMLMKNDYNKYRELLKAGKIKMDV